MKRPSTITLRAVPSKRIKLTLSSSSSSTTTKQRQSPPQQVDGINRLRPYFQRQQYALIPNLVQACQITYGPKDLPDIWDMLMKMCRIGGWIYLAPILNSIHQHAACEETKFVYATVLSLIQQDTSIDTVTSILISPYIKLVIKRLPIEPPLLPDSRILKMQCIRNWLQIGFILHEEHVRTIFIERIPNILEWLYLYHPVTWGTSPESLENWARDLEFVARRYNTNYVYTDFTHLRVLVPLLNIQSFSKLSFLPFCVGPLLDLIVQEDIQPSSMALYDSKDEEWETMQLTWMSRKDYLKKASFEYVDKLFITWPREMVTGFLEYWLV